MHSRSIYALLAAAALLAASAPAVAQTAPDKPADAPAAATTTPPAQPAIAETPPPAPVDPLLAEVRRQLADTRGTDRADRVALAAFYAERAMPLPFVTAEGFTPRARHAMAEIARADDWGLSASAYPLPQLAPGETALPALADAEIRLGLAVLRYARHARGGRFDPAQISRNFDQKPTLRDPKTVLEAVANSEAPGTYLRDLHPRHAQFERLRQALLKSRGAPQEPAAAPVVRLPDGPLLKPGMDHPHIALLRARLKVAGEPGRESFYDQALLDAVSQFQRDNKMKPDGVIGARSKALLNGDAKPALAGSETQRIIANMERWRWMPENLGDFHVIDNVPEYATRVFKNGQMIHTARIIVGKTDTQTVLFSADMKYVIFHPEWGVPDSIKVNELLPYLRPSGGGGFFGFYGGTDTRVLERHNLKVSFNGRPIDPSTVDFTQVDIRRFTFIQPAGPTNVLGVVKFRFPNKHDIYMHDTPQRELFNQQVRTFSHGCIRVENPGRLAEVLLEHDKGWSVAHVRGLLAQGYNNEVTLNRQIPVHVVYFTAMVGDDGKVNHFGDVYGHDARMLAALAGRPLAPEPPPPLASTKEPPRQAKRATPYKQSANDIFNGLFGN